MTNKTYFLLISILILSSCQSPTRPTPYQEYSSWGKPEGYSDLMISKGVYRIKSTVNLNTNPELAVEYWDLRAAELCGHSNYVDEKTITDEPVERNSLDYRPVVIGTVFCNKQN